jgi:endoglucanase
LLSVVFSLGLLLHAAALAEADQTLSVRGNQIYSNAGPVHLRGVNRSGLEFMCLSGNGFFDGPHDQNSIQEIKSWNVNAIRLPLNEDCWLGINNVPPAFSGERYRRAVMDFVNLLLKNDMVVILDLHWTAPGNDIAKGQMPMPDMDHAPSFWQSVASHFKANKSVIFDIFNEPYPFNGAWNQTEAWQCWRDGRNYCTGLSYTVAGMQSLVDAVRATGASNIIAVGGLDWSNSLTQWLRFKPRDSLGNLVASWHSYNFNRCNYKGCWEETVAPVAAQVPVIATEIGENDCQSQYITPLMDWLDSKSISYLAWTWNTWSCGSGPSLISSYTPLVPTNYGLGYKNHLASKASVTPAI